jgi:hypothetical protein
MIMRKLSLAILIIFFCGPSYSQIKTLEKEIKELSDRPKRDFKELSYSEPGLNKRVFYNCHDSIFSEECKIERVIYFNKEGVIVSDTTFLKDTLYSVINRVYGDNKLMIIKTHPQPLFFNYKYETTIDSLLLDSTQRPLCFYENGKFSKQWRYDSPGRLTQEIKNPDDELFHSQTDFTYYKDSIISISKRRSNNKYDTIYSSLVFDSLGRLALEKTFIRSIAYHKKGYEVYYDSIKNSEPLHESSRTEYVYESNSKYRVKDYNDGKLSLVVVMALDDSSKNIQNIKMFNGDGILVGQTVFHWQQDKLIKEYYQDGNLFDITEIRTSPLGLIKSKCVVRQRSGSKSYESYSEKGMITQKLQIENGEVIQSMICKDYK